MSNGATSISLQWNSSGFAQRQSSRAHRQLHVVTGTAATPTALMSRIELYGILLGEVAGIRSNLVALPRVHTCRGQIPGQMECVNRDPLQEGSSL